MLCFLFLFFFAFSFLSRVPPFRSYLGLLPSVRYRLGFRCFFLFPLGLFMPHPLRCLSVVPVFVPFSGNLRWFLALPLGPPRPAGFLIGFGLVGLFFCGCDSCCLFWSSRYAVCPFFLFPLCFIALFRYVRKILENSIVQLVRSGKCSRFAGDPLLGLLFPDVRRACSTSVLEHSRTSRMLL